MKVLPKTSSSVCEYLFTRPLGMFLIRHPTVQRWSSFTSKNNQEKWINITVRTLSCRVCTSSASTCNLSAQDSISDTVSQMSLASVTRLAPSLMVVKASSRSFLIWMSRAVRLAQPCSTGIGRLQASRDRNGV